MVGCNIIEMYEMVKGIRPELCLKTSTHKHGVDSIANSVMRTFTRAILMGGIRSSELDSISGSLKKT